MERNPRRPTGRTNPALPMQGPRDCPCSRGNGQAKPAPAASACTTTGTIHSNSRTWQHHRRSKPNLPARPRPVTHTRVPSDRARSDRGPHHGSLGPRRVSITAAGHPVTENHDRKARATWILIERDTAGARTMPGAWSAIPDRQPAGRAHRCRCKGHETALARGAWPGQALTCSFCARHNRDPLLD